MTLDQWLGSRTPPAPPKLQARLQAALRPWGHADAADAPDLCLSAAEDIVQLLIADPSTGRGRALDLLAADALVTYALEAASEQPDTLRRCAELAMRRIARLRPGAST